MKLIVGLGNPGDKYTKTRHNVGFIIADWLQSSVYSSDTWEENKKFQAIVCKPSAVGVILAKPQTFMNNSGIAVKKLATFYKLHTTDVWVVHDDLDIRLGDYKIQKGIGPKLHNGIESIENELRTKDFWRVRVGVDNREDVNRVPGDQYVLQEFTNEEKATMSIVIENTIQDLISRLEIKS
jgi:PTH1 family peptidyl-tRNA hydrolase